jgi:hypothetical protein
MRVNSNSNNISRKLGLEGLVMRPLQLVGQSLHRQQIPLPQGSLGPHPQQQHNQDKELNQHQDKRVKLPRHKAVAGLQAGAMAGNPLPHLGPFPPSSSLIQATKRFR